MLRQLLIIAGVLVCSASPAACGDGVYLYTDEDGTVIFTDIPTEDALNLTKKYSAAGTVDKKRDYEEIISRAADRHGVDRSLVNAVIRVESNFNERAVSRKGALGLMQLMPATAAQMGASNPFNPVENVDAGVRYLRYLIDRFDGDIKLALAAYNAGPTNVEKYGDVPPIYETKNYLKKVFSLYKGTKNLQPAHETEKTMYVVVLEDGTILYTNSDKYLASGAASRL